MITKSKPDRYDLPNSHSRMLSKAGSKHLRSGAAVFQGLPREECRMMARVCQQTQVCSLRNKCHKT